jgi:hypothetical protein
MPVPAPKASALAAFMGCALAAVGASAGCATGVSGTWVEKPAVATPGMVGFGTGTSVSGGNKLAASVSQAVVVAAGSDEKGPSAQSEGDFVWRVSAGTLQLCERRDDARDDCKLATYEGFPPPPLLTFLPTIIEGGNLARGAHLWAANQASAVEAAAVAIHSTQPAPYVEDKAIWVTTSTDALIGAQPVFLCVVEQDLPVCRALPFVSRGIQGSFVLRRGAERVPVLWLHGASNVVQTLGVIEPVNLGIFRCEAVAAHPKCTKAEEVVR